MLTIAVAQTKPDFLEPESNLAEVVRLVASLPAEVYLFPELCLSGYTFSTGDDVRRCAMAQDDPALNTLKDLTADLGIAVCGGYAEAAGDDIYNSAFFIAEGRLLSNYRKTHLYYREREFFSPGDSGFRVVDYRGARFGMMICFDWIFPESARSLALLGAQVILHPANLVLPYCQRAMFARAVENRVFVATANRVGSESNTQGDDLTFTGGSQIVTPTGEYPLIFDTTETAIRTLEIDPAAADRKALNQFNTILEDRRPEMYVS